MSLTRPLAPQRRVRTATAASAVAFALAAGVGVGPIALASQASAATLCVSDSEISWGIKESFRSYIKGSIANGEWTTSGNASDAGSTFVFSGSGQSIDKEAKTGTITTDGSVNFTGHKGILDLTITNPKIDFDTASGTLSATVNSNDKDGNPTEYGEVALGQLSISKLTISGDSFSGNANVSLTDTGSKAFADFYEPGTELDPISFSGSLSEGDCAAPSSPSTPSSGSSNSESSNNSTSSEKSKESNKSSSTGKNPRAKESDKNLASTGGEAATASGARLKFQDDAAENNAAEAENIDTTAAAEGAPQLSPVQFSALAATLIAVAGGCVYFLGRRQKN